jgi:FixJ family two-component response regulator
MSNSSDLNIERTSFVTAQHFGKLRTSVSRVAVVDDDPAMRKALAELLSVLGFATETFDSAAAFLDAAATSEATCLLVDVDLGDISGVELARRLVAAGFKNPIIFLSGHADDGIRSDAAAAGGVAFLNKPFPAKSLMEAITKAIG